MEPNSSNKEKVLSLHMEECGGCPNSSMCYHLNKNIQDSKFHLTIHDKMRLLRDGWIIHESVCKEISAEHRYLLRFHNNYNITISCLLFDDVLNSYKDQVQITIYNNESLEEHGDFQKLFLIKDDKTYDAFLCNEFDEVGRKIHYVFDQNYLDRYKIKRICDAILRPRKEKTITFDSCLVSYLLNGRCPYSYNNYIDITYDGTYRYCPYEKGGKKLNLNFPYIEKEEEYKLLKSYGEKRSCIYSRFFGEHNK